MLLRNYTNNEEIIFYNNNRIKFESLLNEIGNYTAHLKNLGITSGDKITVLSGNNPEFIFLLLSIWNLNAIPVPINFKLPFNDIYGLHNSVKAKTIFLHRDTKINCNNLNGNIVSFPFANKTPEKYKYEFEPGLKNPALILFTSGTVSKPRGVTLTFKNLITSAKNISQQFNFTKNDKFLASLPFFHIGGFSIIIRALLNGGKIIIPSSLNTKEILTSVNKFNPTVISVVPTVLKRMLDNKTEPNPELKIVFVGGGPSHTGLIKTAFEQNIPVVKVYGSTETASMIAYRSIEKKEDIYAGAIPVGNTVFFIENDKKEKLGKNEVGEIVIKGDTIADGYFNKENTNAEKFRAGKYYTSDLGYIDDKNELHIVGRKDDIIISGGENINPYKIENALLTHPGITEAAVIGIDDNEWGQKAIAVIVKAGSFELNKSGLKKYLKTRVANFEIPKEFVFINSLPKNELGKVKKSELKTFILSKRRLT